MKFIGFWRHHLGFVAIVSELLRQLLIGFFIVAFPTIVFAGHFSAREIAPVEVERELETDILHQQWSLNKTATRECVVDSKKLVPEIKPNLETMAVVQGMFDVFLNHRGPYVKRSFAAQLHNKLVPEKKPNFETMAVVPGMFDVFLNHRGPYVKRSFAAHLHKKLVPEKKPNLETMAVVPGIFDVFLNHRGPDVKRSFAAHLHQALQEAECRPFLDKPALEKGQHGQKKIYEALGCASVHVAIFSEHYADSDYCLDELCAMLESKKLIIPVFYDVSPSVLRCEDPDGPYTKALNIHGRRSASEVKKWKDALHTAAELNGFKLDDYNG
jgi:hypothetical protein